MAQPDSYIHVNQKLKHMKVVNGIISMILGIGSLYEMFIKAQTNQDFILGFGLLLMAIIFMCFVIMEEQKEEVERLRHQILKSKGILK